MGSNRKHHVIITGTGRSGTTFLVKLLTRLGFDTGFTTDYLPQKWYKRSYSIYNNSMGGLEHHGLGGNLPYIIKNPKLMWELPKLLKNNSVVIDHVIIPIRDIHAASESRRVNVKNAPEIKDPRMVPGGLEGVKDPQKQEEFFLEKFYEFFHFLSTYNIPVTLLQYPRLVSDSEYLYHKLSKIFKGINKEDFDNVFNEILDPSLVHKYNNNDTYITNIYDDSYNISVETTSNYLENIELKEIRTKLLQAEDTLEDILEFRKPKEVYAELFFKIDDEYTQENSIGKYVNITDEAITFDFEEPKEIDGLRFDPCDDECVICVNTVVIKSNGKKYNLDIVSSNYDYKQKNNGVLLYFLKPDPQILFSFSGTVESVTLYISYLAIGKTESYALALPLIRESYKTLKVKESELIQTYKTLKDTEEQLDTVKSELANTREKLNKINMDFIEIVKDKENQLAQISNTLIDTQKELTKLMIEKEQLVIVQKNEQEELNRLLTAKEVQIEEQQKMIYQLNKIKMEFIEIVKDKENQLTQISNTLIDTQKELTKLMIEKEQLVIEQKNEQEELNRLLTAKEVQIEEQQKMIHQMEKTIEEKLKKIEKLDILITERNEYINLIFSTLSWRITKPLRFIGRVLKVIKGNIKKAIKRIAKGIYYFFPLPRKQKILLKNCFYKYTKFLMKNTEMYKIWEASYKNNNDNIKNEIDTVGKSGEPFSEIINKGHDKGHESQTVIIGYQDVMKEHDSKSIYYKDFTKNAYHLSENDIKLIAFYLPQFHPIKENDEWWGKGFTEWTNVSKALPQFKGHYQPHLPGELNFYDLRVPEVMERQVELAKTYGIYGFCFYYYWFDGRRILEKPLDQFVESDLDFPFCLCWANENWTRSWDGEEKEILLEQKYNNDGLKQFIIDIEKYITDSRYIRIDNKPLLIIYRPALIPNLKNIVLEWRAYCREIGIGDIYILGVYVKSWGFSDHKKFGLDGMLEFPPHSMYETGATLMNDKIRRLNKDFNGFVFDYKEYVENEKYFNNKNVKELFKGICPSWDNTARRGEAATIYHGSTPELYKSWLIDIINHTKKVYPKEKQFVFINAWNEWAEGAHLEPDRKYGYAYLEATREALIETRKKEHSRKIIYVTHDTHFNGAQLLSLHIVQVLKNHFGYQIEIISKSDGVLTKEFEKYGKVYILNENKEVLDKHIQKLYENGFNIAICNTVITGDVAAALSGHGIKVISLIHELPGVIKQYDAIENARKISQSAEKVVFPSEYVYKKFSTIVEVDHEKKVIQPQGLYKKNPFKGNLEEARIRLRRELGLPLDSKIILGVGFGDKRKGIDLFAEVASIVRKTQGNVYFLWVGNLEPNIMETIKLSHKKEVIFIKATSNVGLYYAGADIYLLTSREDPFPSVVLEAMDAETPVIAFKNAGGFSDIVSDQTGSLVEYLNTNEMAKEVTHYLQNEELCRQKGRAGKLLVEEKFDFISYVYVLLQLLGHEYKKVSAIIPNYNYEKYLKERVMSIIDQTYPIYELVFLDDNSSDQSVKVFEEMIGLMEEKGIRVVKSVNEQNSGSVFKQWMRGISLTSGDYIWIAEADDLCSNLFLEEVMKPFYQDSKVVLSYTQSKQMDQDGNIIADNYLEYTKEIDSEKWNHSYIIDGKEEITEALVIKNTIPNVSGVVFKKFEINEVARDIIDFKIAGDLFFYVWLLQKGKIAYLNISLNYHRRHTNSVTKSENNMLHYNEVTKMQDYILSRFEVSQEMKRKIEKYREFLKIYLGLNNSVRSTPLNSEENIQVNLETEDKKDDLKIKRYIQCGAEYRVYPHPSSDPYQNHVATGYNTGNLYIGYAVHHFFNTKNKFNMWKPLSEKEVEEIRNSADVIVMGASNFINERSDFEITAENLQKLKMPIIVLGIGAQAPNVSVKKIKLTKGTEKFLHLISEYSESIGVRGEYTAELLNNLGIKNTTIIGCPTYYLSKDINFKVKMQKINHDDSLRPALNYTNIRQKCDEIIIKYAFNNKIDVIGQTEFIEDYWKKGIAINPNNSIVASLEIQKEQLYKKILGTNTDVIKAYFKDHFSQYYDIDEWAEQVKKYNFFFGTRFHGNMIAIQNGIPALLVAHDSRTKELAEFCNIPYLEAKNLTEDINLTRLYSEMDYSKFNEEYPIKFRKYVEFLKLNNVTDVDSLLVSSTFSHLNS